MARDLARVSAMDGMMWLGFVHCRRSFLQQRGLSAKGLKMSVLACYQRVVSVLRGGGEGEGAQPVARAPAVGKAAVGQRCPHGEISA